MQNTNDKYKDIIALPHPTSKHHTQMPMTDRAAQFSPFAALTGHSEVIKETARLTDERIILDESKIAELDHKLQMLAERISENPEISVTFFREDSLKEGGAYVSKVGRVKGIDRYKQALIMMDGEEIEFGDVVEMEW